ncbi:hypothetical protein ACFFRR_007245 [Megaselia abdita]
MIFAFLRIVGIVFYSVGILLSPLFNFFVDIKKRTLPKITSNLLNIPAIELAKQIRTQEIKSEQVVRAYIHRIKEVDPYLNAVVDDRFEEAIEDAKKVDLICSKAKDKDELMSKYPLLGVPFTVKEACGLKGMSQVIGNHYRKGMRCQEDSEVVKRVKSKGAIPLLVSANPEFCLSWETTSVVHGRCYNPYNMVRTSGGSSGGEGALNGSGASVFGVASDLSGSIRFPALFNGIFGHKPTGTLISIKGHFPCVRDPNFDKLLQIGPITRFAGDLPILMDIFAGEDAAKMPYSQVSELKDLNVFFCDHSWSFHHLPVHSDIRNSISKALDHFRRNGSTVQRLDIKEFDDSIGITYATLMTQERPPNALMDPKNPDKYVSPSKEMLKFFLRQSDHSFPAIFFHFMYELSENIPQSFLQHYLKEKKNMQDKLSLKLGTNGVLLYPTFHCPAFLHNTSAFQTMGTMYSGLFNMIGFPATHVPMGLNKNGLPIGFQVVAAPFQDRLCFQIAKELETSFGGWVPPS